MIFLINIAEPAQIVEAIIKLVTVGAARYLKCNPLDAIQVLSPMRKTLTGVDNLNPALQKVLNPQSNSKPELRIGERIYRQRGQSDGSGTIIKRTSLTVIWGKLCGLIRRNK